jgi:hypothetical protein
LVQAEEKTHYLFGSSLFNEEEQRVMGERLRGWRGKHVYPTRIMPDPTSDFGLAYTAI